MRRDELGSLDEAWERLHRWGPERQGWPTNHAPMAVEALTRHGHGAEVTRWLDRYQRKLEPLPATYAPVHDGDWRAALGDPTRVTDWIGYFRQELAEQPWRAVLTRWWPRLLPGLTGGATHVVIRTGHVVRVLLDSGDHPEAPRLDELAHALGYWAARFAPLPRWRPLPTPLSPADALTAVPRAPDRSGGIRRRLPQITALPRWPGQDEVEATSVRTRLASLVGAAARHYVGHAHDDAIMLVHAVTAPNAVARTLPALPERLWPMSLAAAWEVSAAVVAAYSPSQPTVAVRESPTDAADLFARAASHGDEHVVKLADSVLDLDADTGAWAAVVRALELIPSKY